MSATNHDMISPPRASYRSACRAPDRGNRGEREAMCRNGIGTKVKKGTPALVTVPARTRVSIECRGSLSSRAFGPGRLAADHPDFANLRFDLRENASSIALSRSSARKGFASTTHSGRSKATASGFDEVMI